MLEFGDLPESPSWFRRGEASWAAVLVLVHPEKAIRDSAWAALNQVVKGIARELGKYRSTRRWIKSWGAGQSASRGQSGLARGDQAWSGRAGVYLVAR